MSALAHRGPDDEGLFLDDDLGVGFGHRRLAIMDPPGGHQPMLDLEQTVVLAYNGEIYTPPALRRDLEAWGYPFQTHSDSEYIIALYKRYGTDFVQHLRGEFAFLLLDRTRRSLYACRDRFGIKPLMLCRTGDNGWVFASEAKALFAAGACKPEIDWPGYMNDENRTLFRGVYDLPPASLLLLDLDSGRAQNTTYWKPDFPAQYPADSPGIDDIDRELTEAVQLRLKADLPVGVYLSGGLDSSLVAAKMASIVQQPLNAFTVAFTDAPHPYNEFPRAARTAAHLGLNHTSIKITQDDLWNGLEDCLWHTEAPIPNLAPVGKLLLARGTKKQVSVVLTGEGADEVFLGYSDFRKHARRRAGTRIRARSEAALCGCLVRACLRNGFRRRERNRTWTDLLGSDLNDSSQQKNRHPLVTLQYRRFITHLRRIILPAYSDRMEMSHGLEGRLPFLDHHLFEIAKRIPPEQLMGNGEGKAVLRQLARKYLPEEIANAPKWPFSSPDTAFDPAQATPAQQALQARHLSRSSIESADLFRWQAIRFLLVLRRWRKVRRRIDRWLFTVCCLQILHAHFCTTVLVRKQRGYGERDREVAQNATQYV